MLDQLRQGREVWIVWILHASGIHRCSSRIPGFRVRIDDRRRREERTLRHSLRMLVHEYDVVAARMALAGITRAVPLVRNFRELVEAIRGVGVRDASLELGGVVYGLVVCTSVHPCTVRIQQ